MKRGEASEREVGGKSDALSGAGVEESLVGPMSKIIVILYANDGSNGLRLGELLWRDIAEAEVTDKALFTEFGKDAKRFGDGFLKWSFHGCAYPKVDDVKSFKAEVSEVVVDGGGDIVPG